MSLLDQLNKTYPSSTIKAGDTITTMPYPTAAELKTMTRPERLTEALKAWCEIHQVQFKSAGGKIVVACENTGEELLSIALAGKVGVE